MGSVGFDDSMGFHWCCGWCRLAALVYLRHGLPPKDAAIVCEAIFGKHAARKSWLGGLNPEKGNQHWCLAATLGNLAQQPIRTKMARKRGGGVGHGALVDVTIMFDGNWRWANGVGIE
jgi:hypothetical protein